VEVFVGWNAKKYANISACSFACTGVRPVNF
jgi:hypothetical protein